MRHKLGGVLRNLADRLDPPLVVEVVDPAFQSGQELGEEITRGLRSFSAFLFSLGKGMGEVQGKVSNLTEDLKPLEDTLPQEYITPEALPEWRTPWRL